MSEPHAPPARLLSARERLLEALAAGPRSARELSRVAGLSEREIFGHLPHLRRTLKSRGQELAVTPAACLDCQFVFSKRERLTRPGRCPVCRSTHLSEPLFALDA